MSQAVITGQEAMFANVVLSADDIKLINMSPTLVSELLQYNADVLAHKVNAIVSNPAKQGVDWDPNNNYIEFGTFGGSSASQLDATLFVGTLAHELGHYINNKGDLDLQAQYAGQLSSDYNFAAWMGLHQEGEAVYNNFIIYQEIRSAGGPSITVNGGTSSPAGTALITVLDGLYAQSIANGISSDVIKNLLIDTAGGYFASLPTSVSGQTYEAFYGTAWGAHSTGVPVSPAASIEYRTNATTGLIESIERDLTSGQVQIVKFDASLAYTSSLYGAGGQIEEFTSFSASNFKLQDIYFDGSGNKTQQYDFNLDSSYVVHVFNSDGTQVAGVFDPNDQMTEYATFAVNGFKTEDLFFTNGRETTRYDFVEGGNTTKYEFHVDGSQNVSLFGPNGQLTEYATFAADGFKTQDRYFTNATETTRYDFVEGGNTTKYEFHVDGTQNVSLFGPNGQLTEYATFAANGFKTQDRYFTNATETTRYDFVEGGNTTKYEFHVDGTQNVSLFGPSGQLTEYATFAANGSKTQDRFFTNGHLTQENDFLSNGNIIVHMINGDNSETATLYGANGMQQELAKYDYSGRLYQDFQWDSSGHITQQINFNADGSRTVFQFHADNSYDAYLFNSALQETEFDSFNALGNLTGFYKYSYNNDGSYWSTQYDATGHAIGKSEYSSSGQWLQNGGIYIPGNGGSFPIGNLMFSGQI
ncbi:hypothetical protein [Paraburkholderia youngii]|uniref:hypothetical protein n=1 Tax=Paraburkholderia youngii TaxID=2782701 RepID=UPI003D193BF2